jgi:hypothetical protein
VGAVQSKAAPGHELHGGARHGQADENRKYHRELCLYQRSHGPAAAQLGFSTALLQERGHGAVGGAHAEQVGAHDRGQRLPGFAQKSRRAKD